MTRNVAQISLFVVGLLVGLLLIGQLRSQARPTEVSSLSAQELSQLIETLSTRNAELRTALSDQRDTLREYQAADPVGQSALQVSREDLARITAFGGLAPVTGDQVRITHRSVAVQGPTSLLVDDLPVGRRFTVRAIGSPEGLLSTIERPGGIIAQLEQFIDASIVATQSDDLELPATRADLTPQVAQPAE